MPPLTRILLAASALFTLTACSSVIKTDGAKSGPFYTPANVQGVARLPESLRRIAILPCAGTDPQLTEDTLRNLDRILAATLTRAARAEVTPFDRDAVVHLTGRPNFVSTSVLPANFLKKVAAATGAEAILFVDATAYSPYPPLVLGLRARLVDAATGEALWNFDNIFSTSTPSVANSARAHNFGRSSATATPGDLSYTVLQNPPAFADYVASATWATLPPR
ncbi:hypothetical protein [Rariglobus hedericola]|uniref:Uncharacterized protein n=1 Tax=Rariglobus hedericola TaxID=2597822 RepID=A0A556QPQ6_9BACT|nr:hypothetical protein [Rariglobus hedericola]TSJ78582.1 hypothetical protein FPL22_04580 [Rariglobus hedericola]